MKNHLSKRLVCAFSLALNLAVVPAVVISAQAQAQEVKASEKKTRKVPTLRGKVYEQLARAQAAGDDVANAAGGF